MKIRMGISNRFIAVISIFFIVFIFLLTLGFFLILKQNHSVISEVLIKSSTHVNRDKVTIVRKKLGLQKYRNINKLSRKIRDICRTDDVFYYVIIYSRTEDENYFKVEKLIPLQIGLALDLEEKSMVRENKKDDFLKKGLVELTHDPAFRLTNGIYWQNLYLPFKLKRKHLVLQFFMSSQKNYQILAEYTAKMNRIKNYLIAMSMVLLTGISITGFLFIHNFSLLIRSLSTSMERAAKGELDINLNSNADEELSELAVSFNTLISEMKDLKEKGKITDEKETKEDLNDIFKRGVELLKENKLEEAIAVFSTLVIMKPDGFGSYFNLGVAQAKMKNYDRSIENFNTALRTNPGHELTLQYIQKVRRLMLKNESITGKT